MRRAAWGLVVLAAGCGRCKSGGEVTALRDDPAHVDAAHDAGDDAAGAIPREWQGTYVLAIAIDADASTPIEIRRVEVGAHGPAAMERVVGSDVAVQSMALAPDGASLAYTATTFGDAGLQEQAIEIVPLAGGTPKQIAHCGYQCTLMGIGADGEVWYVDVETGSLVGDVQHVPSKGGAAVAWPNTFANCALSGTTSDDGTALLLGVDDSLGWPECIATGKQGFFVVPIADAAKRDLLPKRIDCFTTRKATDINLQIFGLAFEGSDRVRLTLVDGWDPSDAAQAGIPSTWSCKRDGTDAQLVTDAGPAVGVVDGPKGKQSVAVLPDGEEADLAHALHRIVSVDGSIEAMAFRKR